MPANSTADELSDTMDTGNAHTEDLDMKKPRNWITVNWVRENFEEAEGVNISRCSIYDSYLEYAVQANIEPVNTASFGKLMRTAFPQLSTRRLGVRGQSKSHYNGIRVRATSALLEKVEVHEKTGHGSKRSIRDAMKSFMTQLDVLMPMNNGQSIEGHPNMNGAAGYNPNATSSTGSYASQSLPELPSIDESRLPIGFPTQNLPIFINAYFEHCQEILAMVTAGNFPDVESVIRTFWQQTVTNVLRSMTEVPVMIEWIGECDVILYSTIAVILVPDILRHIPMERMQLMRSFARNLQSWITHYMQGLYPISLTQRKLLIAKSFLETLKKSTVVNHVTEAARSALLNESRVTDMAAELSRLDFDSFKADLLWATQYPEEPVRRAFLAVRELLSQKAPVEMWANWLELLLGQCVRTMQATLNLELGGNQDVLFLQKLPLTMRHTVVRWSFFADTILRELSLRSSPVFGSFHLLRLFMNEYLSFIAEKMVAHVRLAFYQERSAEQVWRAIHPLMVFYLDINQYFPGMIESNVTPPDYENAANGNMSVGTAAGGATGVSGANNNNNNNNMYPSSGVFDSNSSFYGVSAPFFGNSTDNFANHHSNSSGMIDEPMITPAPPLGAIYAQQANTHSHPSSLHHQHAHLHAHQQQQQQQQQQHPPVTGKNAMMAMMSGNVAPPPSSGSANGVPSTMSSVVNAVPGKKIRMDSSLAHILDLKKD